MSWSEQAEKTLNMLLENMVAEGTLAHKLGIEALPSTVVGASREMLLDVIRTSLPLAHIMDTSDLVLHAEGPAVHYASPRLSAVNWLTGTAEGVIRRLSGSMFDLADRDAKRLARALDLRFNGFAPGSLYAGFSIEPPPPDMLLENDDPVVKEIRIAVRNLPALTSFIRDEDIDPDIREMVSDPAQRDTSLTALYELSPTGRRGIHTLDISSPGLQKGELSQRERVVLKEAINTPVLHERKSGRFVGELREIDLDARRFHLRGVAGVGSLRCVINSLDRINAKNLLGEFVTVEGEYESNREGRPRLMIVTSVTLMPRANQPPLDLN